MMTPAPLDAATWAAALRGRDARAVARLEEERARLKADPERLRYYVGLLRAHLDSQDVDLPLANAQRRWLSRGVSVQGVSTDWLLSVLDLDNHLGSGDVPPKRLLHSSFEAEQLPWLVAELALRLAVRESNRWRFSEALSLVAHSSWLHFDPTQLDALTWARLLSAEGQYHAFLGRPGVARLAFDAALEVFEARAAHQDSDPQGDVRRTRNYRAIAVMDDPRVGPQEAEEALLALGGHTVEGLVDAVLRTPVGVDSGYTHHTVVRYLALRGSEAARARYLQGLPLLETRDQHPWELIALHQALLLRADQPARAVEVLGAAMAPLLRAVERPVLQLIGLTLGGLLYRWGVPVEGTEAVFSQVRRALPDARKALGIIRRAGAPATDQAYLAAALPFNFR